MPLPLKIERQLLTNPTPSPTFLLCHIYDWIILNLFMVVFQPLGRLGYPLDWNWIDGGLEIKTALLAFAGAPQKLP